MPVKRPVTAFHRRAAASPEVPALGPADLQLLSDVLAETAPGWSAELHGICASEASVIVMPAGGEDLLGPSFIVSRECAAYRVSQIHWDVMTTIGYFPQFAEAVVAIRRCLLTSLSPSGLPLSATRH